MAQAQTLRGVLPTYVTDTTVGLCKRTLAVQNTYEIRLAIYFAVKDNKRFELRVPEGASADSKLAELISQQGGKIISGDCTDFTISITHFDQSGKERDSWVVGDDKAWNSLLASIHSSWIKSELKPGAVISSQSLLRLETELSNESIQQENIDNENIKDALLRTIQECKTEGGYVLVQ